MRGAGNSANRTLSSIASKEPHRMSYRTFTSALIAAAALLLAAAAPAAAAPAWHLYANANTNAEAGGEIEYFTQFTNIGDETANGTGGEPIELSLALPPEASVDKVGAVFPGFGFLDSSELEAFLGWSCSGDGPVAPGVEGARNVTCQIPDEVEPHISYPLSPIVKADVDGAATGTLESVFSLGGAGVASTVSTFEATRIAAGEPPFGIEVFDGAVTDPAGDAYTQAAGHPFVATTTIDYNTATHSNPAIGPMTPIAATKTLEVELPPGFVGDPTVVPTCTVGELVGGDNRPTCPSGSQVGTTMIRIGFGSAASKFLGPLPVFSLEPPRGVPARFGMNVLGSIVMLEAAVRSEGDHGLTIRAENIPSGLVVSGTDVTFWGVPADASHTPERSCPGALPPEHFQFSPDDVKTCASGLPLRPLLRNPTSCTEVGEGLTTGLRADSWKEPGSFDSGSFVSHEAPGYPRSEANWGPEVGVTGCGKVPFDPGFDAIPAAGAQAGEPAGFAFDLSLPQSSDPVSTGQSDLKKAVVTLPKGLRVNPSSAQGLGACTLAQANLDSRGPANCPDSAKIGSLELETPLLDHTMNGSIYLAKQFDNPFDSLLAIYLAVKDPESGVNLKLPGEVSPQADGQLIATFDDQPQLPFDNLHLEFKGGPRAPLSMPKTCGTYEIDSTFTGWNGKAVNVTSPFTVNQGCAGQGFDPKLQAGTANPLAGASSPFVLRLTRSDADQELSGIEAKMPLGLTGYLKGIPYCPQSAIDAAKAMGNPGQGASVLASPPCSEASQVGNVVVGAGAGTNPFYLDTGKAYLAGPYKGAPLSIAFVTPAVAGPFDLGNVVVQAALNVDPVSTQITAISDPLPSILHGIPLQLRDVRVSLDRPRFTLNPTSCEEKSIEAKVTSTQGATATPSSRFQVVECASLGFKPRLAFNLKGKTARGGFPALRAVYRPRRGDANLRDLVVRFPRSEFVEQSHFRTLCTRVQFAAEACPKGSIYGKVTATTPLLDEPLKGPVYLRSSNNKLPDAVLDLNGQIDAEVAIRIDSVRGALRATVTEAPDVPITKVVLRMQGGKKGLFVNSRDICARSFLASVQMDGQNGAISDSTPQLRASCTQKVSKGRR